MFGAVAGLKSTSSPSSSPDISLGTRGLKDEAVAGVELVRDELPLLEFMAGRMELDKT